MNRPPEFFHESLVITAPRHALRRWPGIAAVGLHALLGGGLLAHALFSFERLDPPENRSARVGPPPVIVRLGDGRPPGARAAEARRERPETPRIPADPTRRLPGIVPPPVDPHPATGTVGDPVEGNGTEPGTGGSPLGDPDGDPDGSPDGVVGGAPDGTGTGNGTGTEIYREYVLPNPLSVRLRVEPAYPESARQNGLEATVIVELVVDEAGNVTDARVVRSDNALFNENALRAVRQWKYSAATLDGRRIRIYKTATIRFQLH